MRVRINQCTQVDLMFCECAATHFFGGGGSSGMSTIRQQSDHIILHLVDERIRWSVAVEISSNTPEDTADTIMTFRINTYGNRS